MVCGGCEVVIAGCALCLLHAYSALSCHGSSPVDRLFYQEANGRGETYPLRVTFQGCKEHKGRARPRV